MWKVRLQWGESPTLILTKDGDSYIVQFESTADFERWIESHIHSLLNAVVAWYDSPVRFENGRFIPILKRR